MSILKRTKQRIWYHVNQYRSYLITSPISCTTGVTDTEENGSCAVWFSNAEELLVIENGSTESISAFLNVYDLKGSLIVTQALNISNNSLLKISLAEQLNSGVYFVQLIDSSRNSSGKMISITK